MSGGNRYLHAAPVTMRVVSLLSSRTWFLDCSGILNLIEAVVLGHVGGGVYLGLLGDAGSGNGARELGLH